MSHDFPPTIPFAKSASDLPEGPATIWRDSTPPTPPVNAATPATTDAAKLSFYAPRSVDVMDIPAIDDPQFMPALAYWSKYLKCSLPQLAEAHARVGRSPSIQTVLTILDKIKAEEKTGKASQMTTVTPQPKRGAIMHFAKTWTAR